MSKRNNERQLFFHRKQSASSTKNFFSLLEFVQRKFDDQQFTREREKKNYINVKMKEFNK